MSKKKSVSKKQAKSEEIELDFKKIIDFFTDKRVLITLLILIPMFLSAYFRYYPATLPIADEWAENSIKNNMRNQILSQINQQYPNLPDASKNQLVNEQLNDYLQNNQDSFKQAIEQSANSLRQQFKAEDGTTYLLAIDPYYYYRQTKNLVETGHVYDEIRDGIPYDTHMIAPVGYPLPDKFTGGSFHVYFSSIVHKFLRVFNNERTIMASFFLIPLIISMLAVIPAFFLARKVAGNLGGFFAATIVAVHSVFLGRTPAGFSDTDAYNVFFPLLIAWLFLEAFEAKDIKKKAILGGAAGLTTGIYSFAWTGWWYIFDFILYSMIGYLIYYIILHRDELKKDIKEFFAKKDIKNIAVLAVTFLLLSGVTVSIFKGPDVFLSAPTNPINFIFIKDSAKLDLWPNVFTTVAELNEVNVSQIIGQIGGKFFFLIALIGILLTALSDKKKDIYLLSGSALWFLIIISYHNKISSVPIKLILFSLPIAIALLMPLINKEENIDIKYAIFLTMWMMGTIFASTKGVRFVLMLVPAFAVAFGIAIGKIHRIGTKWFSEEFELDKRIGSILLAVILLILLISPIKAADATARREIPSMNDGWYRSLKKIDNGAAPDAIINSWWDFGHWFKAIGNRAVTFDGGSQNTPMAHWIGKTLLTGEEDTAIGILRMLDCGSNNAFDELNKVIDDTPKTVDILNEIIVLDKIKAKAKLSQYSNKETADEVIELTHCEPPENYFITSEDMVGKAGVWAHFGSWDFRKAKVWIDYRKLTFDEFVEKAQNELGYDEKTAKDMFYQIHTLSEGRSSNTWISPWPSYLSGKSSCWDGKDGTYLCANGIVINQTNYEAWVKTNDGILHPKTFAYVDENGDFQTNEYDKGKVLTNQDGSFIGAAMLKVGNGYQTILMSDELVDSTFTKLFYFDGAGTTNFEKFSDLRDVTGQRIIIWKVNWDGIENNNE